MSAQNPLVQLETQVSRFRPEIQALRAFAAIIGVGFHLWPDVFPGGFYGNEVFFVLSGFLITALILREIERTGAVSLSNFWARRVRRLLPAALFVLLAAGLATLRFLPDTLWQKAFAEIDACVVYLQNVRLSLDRVDYWAAGRAPSPVQHYWSLSVEEQFYIVWPGLLLLAAASARRFSLAMDRCLRCALFGVTAASLFYWLHATRTRPITAYYDTAAHAWQFGAGGLLAAWGGGSHASRALRAASSWAGTLMIAFSALFITSTSSFYGVSAAVPVLGTLLVIWSGAPEHPWGPSALYTLRPIQFLGEISYGVCLWHWPLIILVPYVLSQPLDVQTRLAVAICSVCAAVITKYAVEDPFRHGQALHRRGPWLTFLLAAAAMLAMLAFSRSVQHALLARALRETDETAALLRKGIPCLGAASRDPDGPPCRNSKLDSMLIPSDFAMRVRFPRPPLRTRGMEDRWSVIEFGAPAEQAALNFALIGDSTARGLRVALKHIATTKKWHGALLAGCAPRNGAMTPSCVAWKSRMLQWLGRHPEVDTLFTTAFPRRDWGETASDGYLQLWAMMPASIKRIIVIRTNPENLQPHCVQEALERGRKPALVCADPRAKALLPDPAVEAAARLGSSRVKVVDLTQFYCDESLCYHVIGGVRLYSDSIHLTPEYWRTLAPYLEREIDALRIAPR